MKKQLLFLSVAVAALLAGCSKTEPDAPGADNTPATQITAKARGAGAVSLDTKAPVTGTSLNNQTADVYTSSEDLSAKITNLNTMFTEIYARGTMTFDDNSYVVYNPEDFGGAGGGNALLPQDGTVLYNYAFYPKGWTRVAGTEELLTYTFDGKTDLMATWLTTANDTKIKYNDVANMPDRADFLFLHLLTRYNINVKASDADAITAWGVVKSVKMTQAVVQNRVTFGKTGGTLQVAYDNDGGATPTPAAFYKLSGADVAKPTYTEDLFEGANVTLTTTAAPACYAMVAPVEVADADPTTAELTLEVTTTVGGKDKTTTIPVSLQQSKFTANASGNYSTRGYAISLTLNFRAGAIQAIATVEEWKEYGNQNINVDITTPAIEIGDVKDGGIVYEVNGANYKVFSLDEGNLAWAAQTSYVIGSAGQSDTDGKANTDAIKAYFAANEATVGTDFSVAFPAAEFCDRKNTGGVTGWYLPAKEELVALSKAYKAHKDLLDKAITDNSGTAPASGIFWSSTENSNNPYPAWRVGFSTGGTGGSDKNIFFYVRCVKSTVPPAIGDLRDGGVVYEVTDNTHYKVMTQMGHISVAWAEKDTYIVSGARSDTDGRANSDAIKAYYDTEFAAGRITSDFNTAFPAAAYCYNFKGSSADVEGTWYLPAAKEIQLVYFATNSVSGINWGQNHITSTESTDTPANYWIMSPINSGALSQNTIKTSYSNVDIRCMRNSVATPPAPPAPPTPPAPPKVGDLKDGGIVYWIDPADPTLYKVFSLDESSLAWAAQTSYVIGSAGQSATDGKANVAAIKAYFAANTATVGADFSVAFPAAEFCDRKNMGGVTGWYLPATEELVALSKAYKAHKDLLDKAITDNSGTAPASGIFWSSTENSSYTNIAWIVVFSNGYANSDDKSLNGYYVRCVREN